MSLEIQMVHLTIVCVVRQVMMVGRNLAKILSETLYLQILLIREITVLPQGQVHGAMTV